MAIYKVHALSMHALIALLNNLYLFIIHKFKCYLVEINLFNYIFSFCI